MASESWRSGATTKVTAQPRGAITIREAVDRLAPDSNALRVLQRLNFVPERKSYATSYAAARKFAADELGADTESMLRAHQLLRRHGQERCTRTAPACLRCPLAPVCPRIGVAA